MRTIRRLYFYLLAFISLEVVLWSVITLLRTIFESGNRTFIGDSLAGGLAFLIVGLPMFLFHWNFVQRESLRDTEERSSRLREVFLYGTYLATLIPIAQNIVALLDRLLLSAFGREFTDAFLGGSQSPADNIIAIVIMGCAFLYFNNILRKEYTAATPGNDLTGTRRLFRYIWMLYSLVLLIVSLVFLLQYILSVSANPWVQLMDDLANGLAILLVMAPLWAFNWQVIQRSLTVEEEYRSSLRLVVLYVLTLTGIIVTLVSAGQVLAVIFNSLLKSEVITPAELVDRFRTTLSIAIPMGMVWAYYGRVWKDTTDQADDPLQKAALRRFYYYVLSLLGNFAVFLAIMQLMQVLIEIISGNPIGLANYSDALSSVLALLIVGLPVWLRYWPGLQAEASSPDETGDHARRSIIRKSYLYLLVFSLVVGLMFAAGKLLYSLLVQITVEGSAFDLEDFLQDIRILAVILVWLAYHFVALRNDGRTTQAALAVQHSAFPVAVIDAGNMIDLPAIQENLSRLAPNIPVTALTADAVTKGALEPFKAVVFSGNLITGNPQVFHILQQEYSGQRLLVPEPAEGWTWLGLVLRNRLETARETAQLIRMMAEKQVIRAASTAGPLTITAYVLGGLTGLVILIILLTAVMSPFIR